MLKTAPAAICLALVLGSALIVQGVLTLAAFARRPIEDVEGV